MTAASRSFARTISTVETAPQPEPFQEKPLDHGHARRAGRGVGERVLDACHLSPSPKFQWISVANPLA